MSFPLPERGDLRRFDAAWLHRDLVTAIAYTNALHLCSGDPEQWIRDNHETWNHQLAYAEIIIDSLIANNMIHVRGYKK